jgi:hypothetical protein
MSKPNDLFDTVDHADFSGYNFTFLIIFPFNCLLETVVSVISGMHDTQLMQVATSDITGNIGIEHSFRLRHNFAGDFGDHATHNLRQEQSDIFHVPSDRFLLFFNSQFSQVVK